MSGARVLVVEDSNVARALLVRTLSRAGFEVIEAENGVEGAVRALAEHPDLVVTDLEMPIMDGYQLLRLLKTQPSTAHVPVVILTSHGEAPSRFWGARTGADHYLTKDNAPEELVTLAHALLKGTAERPPAGTAAPRSATDVLALVARTLDSTLLEATLSNTLLERGIAAPDFRGALRAALNTIGEVVDAHVIALGVAEPQLVTLHVVVPHPLAEETVEGVARSLLNALPTVPGAVVEVVVDGNRTSEPSCQLGEVFTLPLQLHNAAGCLAVLPRSAAQFDGLSQHLVQASTRHLGLVLDNARLAQRLRELSMLDGLTRQLNHRAINERLAEELKRALRYGKQLAVVIGDLDHFKEVNDRWGHMAGDAALQSAAQAMRAVLRAADSLGRFGGEEFLAILPESDLEAARQAAERLRRAVQGSSIVLPSGETISITMSLGAAALHELPGAVTTSALISRADARLYEAKAAGRNCVRP